MTAKQERKRKPMTCPLCGKPLDVRLDGFTCNAAVHGVYLKGSARLTCSDTACKYMHSTNFTTRSKVLIDKLLDAIGRGVAKLPDMGPWEVFSIRDKPRQTRRRG